MEHGTQCHLSTCLSLTFLPLACPFCRHDFCESHFLPTQHLCSAPGSANYNRVLSETELLKRILKVNDGQQQAGASGAPGGRRRLPCQKSGCKRFSLEVEREGEDVDSALGGSGAGNRPEVMVKNAESVKVFRHRAPTCPRCHALFCVSHLDPRDHQCSVPPPPTEGQQRMQAADERKRKAKELLAKNFPNRKT